MDGAPVMLNIPMYGLPVMWPRAAVGPVRRTKMYGLPSRQTRPIIKVQVKTGSVYGDMQRQQVALYNENQEEIGCSSWISTQGTIIMQLDTLTPGNQYWIAVDDDRVSSTFTICTDDLPDYDFKAGALEITDISNWCSPEEAYSNLWATDDESMASCWSGTENKNVWFKFQATTRFITVNLRTGNVYGDIRRPQMALWNEAGTEVNVLIPSLIREHLL